MDTLFHFILAFVGAYILMEGLQIEYSFKTLIIFSLFSLALDGFTLLHHIIKIGHVENLAISHNIFLAILLPLAFYIAFSKKDLKIYSIIIMVLFAGHLIADMITYENNMIGIPLFYPLSENLYLIPDLKIRIFKFTSSSLLSSASVGLAIYFGLIFSIFKLNNKYAKNLY